MRAEQKAVEPPPGVHRGTVPRLTEIKLEMRSIGTRSRKLLRQFQMDLAEMDYVDDLRSELRRFQGEYLDEIDSKSVGWIDGFLAGLIPIIRTACESFVEPELALVTANPIKRTRGRPVTIPDERKAKALELYTQGDDPVTIARILYATSNPTPKQKSNIDRIIRQYAEKRGLSDPSSARRTNRIQRA